jgi:hypothetical protein
MTSILECFVKIMFLFSTSIIFSALRSGRHHTYLIHSELQGMMENELFNFSKLTISPDDSNGRNRLTS